MIGVIVPVARSAMARPSSESRARANRGTPDTYVSSIHVTDGSAAGAAAQAAPAGVYKMVDDEHLTKRAYAAALGEAAGVVALSRCIGSSALLIGRRTTSHTRSLMASNRRFRGAVGCVPVYRDARKGWRALDNELR
jgi:hypothetical protein